MTRIGILGALLGASLLICTPSWGDQDLTLYQVGLEERSGARVRGISWEYENFPLFVETRNREHFIEIEGELTRPGWTLILSFEKGKYLKYRYTAKSGKAVPFKHKYKVTQQAGAFRLILVSPQKDVEDSLIGMKVNLKFPKLKPIPVELKAKNAGSKIVGLKVKTEKVPMQMVLNTFEVYMKTNKPYRQRILLTGSYTRAGWKLLINGLEVPKQGKFKRVLWVDEKKPVLISAWGPGKKREDQTYDIIIKKKNRI